MSKSQNNIAANQMLPQALSRQYRHEQTVALNDVYARYEAYDLRAFKPVVLTVLSKMSAVRRTRLLHALSILTRAQHRSILPVLEQGCAKGKDGNVYYWTTPRARPLYVCDAFSPDGDSAEPLGAICDLVADILDGLEFAHENGIFHGFISSSSIVRYDGHYCLNDFMLPNAPSQPMDTGPSIHTDLKGIGITLREILELANVPSRDDEQLLLAKLKDFSHRLCETDHKQRFTSVGDAKTDLANAMQVLQTAQSHSGKALVRTAEARKVSRSNDTAKLMPVLDKTLETVDATTFRDVIIVHINHSTQDMYVLNDALCFLNAELVFVAVPYGCIDVPSSLPYSVYHASRVQDGFELNQNHKCFDRTAFDTDAAIAGLISKALVYEALPALRAGKKKLLIVEDGGYHYDLLDSLQNQGVDLESCIIGAVEQTASGTKRCIRYSQDRKLPYPVVTVARSDIKMRFESHFIAQRVVEGINALLYQSNGFLSFHNVVVLGYGIIGRAITAILSRMNCKVFVADTNSEICRIAEQDGYEVLREPQPHVFDRQCVVIGATGDSSFTHPMLVAFLRSSALVLCLASASSRRIEFAHVIDYFEGNRSQRERAIRSCPDLAGIGSIEIELNKSGLIYHFKFDGKHRSVLMLAQGFPVNFYGPQGISLTHSVIDLVYTEILLSAQYLVNSAGCLEKKLYVLGGTPMPDLGINEAAILAEWLRLNRLVQPAVNTSVWSGFAIHPLEEQLRTGFLISDP